MVSRANVAIMLVFAAAASAVLLCRLPLPHPLLMPSAIVLAGILVVEGRALLRGVGSGPRAQYLLLALVVAGAPVIKWRGPGNTSVADLPAALLIGYSGLVALRRRRLLLPDRSLLLPVLGIVFAGVIASFASPVITQSVLTLAQDVYVLCFWIAIVNLPCFAEAKDAHRNAGWVARLWVVVGAFNALLVCIGVAGLTEIASRLLAYPGGGRGVGLFRDPNMAAHYLGASLFMVPAAVRSATHKLEKLILLAAGFALLGGVLATGSNGAKVGLVASLAAVAFLWALGTGRESRHSLGLSLVLCATASALFLLGTADLGRLPQLSLTNGPFRLASFGPSLQVRVDGWRSAFEAFLSAPIGVGPGVLGAVEGNPGLGATEAHNDVLSMLAERGLLGGLAYACFAVAMIWQSASAALRRGKSGPLGPSLTPLSVLGMFVFMLAMGLSVDSLHFRHFWFLAGVYLTAVRWQTMAVRW